MTSGLQRAVEVAEEGGLDLEALGGGLDGEIGGGEGPTFVVAAMRARASSACCW